MAAIKCSEIITQLKQIKAERGLSFQKIVDMVEETGGSISLTTVRRIFSDGSEELNYRYDDTIKPLIVALLDINKPPERGEDISLVEHELDTLRMVVTFKEQVNQDLRAENNRLTVEASDKQNQIMTLIEQLRQKDCTILWLSTCLIAVLGFICIVLIYDISNLSTGFVRVFTGVVPIAIAVIVAVIVVIAIFAISRKKVVKK